MGMYTEQFKKIWTEFGPAQKISMLLGTLAVVTAAAALLVWSSKPSMQLLYGRMSSEDISEAVAHLDSQGVRYQIGSGGSSLLVPSDKVYALRMDLAAKGVPSGGNVGFEIFDETNFGVSDFVQKTNYMRAIQGELSRTIAQLQGVRSARVMISVPENKLLAKQSNTHPTASVFVDTGGSTLTDQSVNSIRFLVANSVEGLKVDEVAVVDNRGNVLSEAVKGDGVFGVSSSRLKYKKGIEDYYVNKIESMLSKVLGRNQVVARVSVDIDTDSSTLREETFDPAGQVIRNQSVVEDLATSDVSAPKQVAGVVDGSGGGDFAGSAQGKNSSKDTTKKKTIAYEISRSTKETVKSAGRVKELTAAVFLATRTTDKGGKVTETPRTEVELQKIREMIVNAIGVSGEVGGDVAKRVTVQEMAFAVEPEVQVAGVLGIPESVFSLFDKFKNYGAIGLALLMFIVFRRMLKNYKPKESSVNFLEDGAGGGPGGAKNVTPRVTVDIINELIQQKPENVSSALKNWVHTEGK